MNISVLFVRHSHVMEKITESKRLILSVGDVTALGRAAILSPWSTEDLAATDLIWEQSDR